MSPTKETNPKDLLGSNKLPLHLFPRSAVALGSIAMLNGMLKYGRNNFRAAPVVATVYVAACMRHLDAWLEGREVDPEDLVPDLGAALACLAILVDAQSHGTLIDDRNFGHGYQEFIANVTAHVPRLKELHKDRTPKHWLITDNKA